MREMVRVGCACWYGVLPVALVDPPDAVPTRGAVLKPRAPSSDSRGVFAGRRMPQGLRATRQSYDGVVVSGVGVWSIPVVTLSLFEPGVLVLVSPLPTPAPSYGHTGREPRGSLVRYLCSVSDYPREAFVWPVTDPLEPPPAAARPGVAPVPPGGDGQVTVVPFLSLGIGIDDMYIFVYTLVGCGAAAAGGLPAFRRAGFAWVGAFVVGRGKGLSTSR